MSPFAFAGRAVLVQTAAIAGGWDTLSCMQSRFGESPAFSSYVVSVEYTTIKKKRKQKTHLELTNCEAHLPAPSYFHSDTNCSVKFDGFLKHGVLLQEQQTLFCPADPNQLPDGPGPVPSKGVLILMERDLVFWVLN